MTERNIDAWLAGPKATRAEQDHFAERYEREWLEPHQGRIRDLWNTNAAFVSGCGPSLMHVRNMNRVGDIVCCNNSWRPFRDKCILCVVFIDSQRFITQALEVPDHIPVCAIPSQCKQVRVMEEWFAVAEQLGDRLIPLRGAGKNGRNTRAYQTELDAEKCVPSLGGSVLFTAIQVAAYLASREVVILGADFDYDGESRHWDKAPRYYEQGAHTMWENGGRDAMIHLYSKMGQKGIVLRNGTPGGKIDCLPRWP